MSPPPVPPLKKPILPPKKPILPPKKPILPPKNKKPILPETKAVIFFRNATQMWKEVAVSDFEFFDTSLGTDGIPVELATGTITEMRRGHIIRANFCKDPLTSKPVDGVWQPAFRVDDGT